jgi:hypothetical protein
VLRNDEKYYKLISYIWSCGGSGYRAQEDCPVRTIGGDWEVEQKSVQ